MNIDGVAAIVTGGASGLGAGTAKRPAAAGARVTIFDLNAELGRSTADQIGGHFVSVNVTDEGAVEAAIEAASIVTNPMLNGETICLDGAIRMAPK